MELEIMNLRDVIEKNIELTNDKINRLYKELGLEDFVNIVK